MDNLFEMVLVLVLVVATVTGVGVGVWSGKIELRPFRTSAIAMGLMLLAALWMALNHDFALASLGMSEDAQVIVNLVIDVSVMMVAVTGYVTALTKLSDDGGESDAITMARILAEKKE